MSLAIGPIARLFTRGMYKFIESRDLWYSKVEPDGITTFELEFWLRNLRQNNGFQIKNNQLTTKIVYSEASGTGYGGHIVERLGNQIAQGKFTEFEKSTSSTYRELLAVKYVLQSFGNSLRHEGVQWYSDNVNVSRIIEAGSSKVYLQKIAIDIFELCLNFDIYNYNQNGSPGRKILLLIAFLNIRTRMIGALITKLFSIYNKNSEFSQLTDSLANQTLKLKFLIQNFIVQTHLQ